MIRDLKQLICDPERVIPREALEDKYLSDTLNRLKGRADALVFALSTKEVSAVMSYASEHGIPVTPRGAGTNLVGSTVPGGGIILDLSRMNRILEIDPAFGGKDSLLFLAHWNDDPALLQTADRIVFCGDNEEETRRAVADLKRCFAVPGAVQARLSVPIEHVDCFGAADEIFTPELVMQEALSAYAVALNERYRKGNPGAPAWNELSDFARRSNLAAADHLQTKLRLLTQDSGRAASVSEALERFRHADGEARDRFRRIEHARWCRFHYLNGWRYAESRDNQMRLHPMLLPFDRLSAEEQAKDDNSWELLSVLQGGLVHEN